MKTKKADVSVLVFLVAGTLVLVVLLMAAGHIGKTLGLFGERAECQWDLLVSAITKTPIVGTLNIPPECKAQEVTISKTYLRRRFKKAKERIDSLVKNRPDIYDEQFLSKGFEFHKKDDKHLYEWTVNEKFADEIKNCWDKVWHGKVDAFDEWWRFADTNVVQTFFVIQEKTIGELVEGVTGINKKWFREDNFAEYGPPTVCVLCSRIKFAADDLPPNLKIKSLENWMMANNVPRDPSQRSYWAYIYSGIDLQKEPLYAWIDPEINVDKEGVYAVIYARQNTHKVDGVLDFFRRNLGFYDLAGWVYDAKPKDIKKAELPDHIDYLSLIKYDDVQFHPKTNKLRCHKLID